MKTYLAVLRNQEAILKGNKPKWYDYKKAIKLMEKYKVKKARLFMAEDREWTEDELTIPQLKKKPKIAGIRKSSWATPTIEIKRKELPCWTYKEQENKIKRSS